MMCLYIRGVARIFGLGGGQTMSCGARPCEHRSCEAHAGGLVLTFFMGLLRKRGEKFFVILCSGGGHLPPLPPSSYAPG